MLVTGAGGLIGGEVSAYLVARGHRVTAMVHNRREVRGNDGAAVPVAGLVTGDVTESCMGLEPHRQDVIVHCAAHLEFNASEEVLAAVNVGGTQNALDHARAAGAAFVHVSTAYVCGLSEGRISEGPVPPGTRFTNSYEASKAAAEGLVERSGLRFAIARPSIVLGDSETGAIREFPPLCNVLRLMARGKVSVFPARQGATLDLVPIDHVAASLACLAERMDEIAGGWFHLVADEPLPAAELALGVERVPHFPNPRVVEPEAYDPARLANAERLLARRMLDTYGAYFTRSPNFLDTALRAATGLHCPPTGRAWLDRLIAYGISQGYLPAPSLNECPDSAGQGAFAPQAPTSPPP